MAGSLLDFGNIAQLSQQNLQNAMHMQQLDLQDRQTAVNEQQLKVNQQSQQTARVNSIKSVMDSDLVQSNPALQDQLFVPIAKELGIPTDGMIDDLTQSRKDRLALLQATVNGDPKAAGDAITKLVYSLPPDKIPTAMKNFESINLMKGKLQQAQQIMQMNEAKFAELRQNQAIVNEGRGPLTALSSILRDQTSILGTPEYKKAQGVYKTLGRASILDPADKTLSEKEKMPLKNLMPGNAEQLAENLEPEIMRWQHQLETANRALIDMDHGVKQPGQMKEQLTARIATAQPILGALRDMQAFYRDPLNSEKATLAKHAYETIEKRRVELESMDKKLDAQRMGLVNLANEKFDYKQSIDSAKAEGQRRWLALPEKQRTDAAAGKISQAIKEELGVDVLPADIYHNPNSPQSVNKTEVHIADKAGVKLAENAMEGIKESHGNAMGALDILDGVGRIKGAISKGNVTLGPGATIRNSISQVANLLGVQGKDQEEQLVNTRETIRGLAQFAVNARKLLRGQGQVTENEQKLLIRAESGEINDFTLPELKTFLNTTERLANRSIANHQRIMGVARKKPELQGYLDFYELPDQSSPTSTQQQPNPQPQSGKAAPSQGGAVLKSLPQGSKQIGTSNGKPVYQGPDGKKWIGE